MSSFCHFTRKLLTERTRNMKKQKIQWKKTKFKWFFWWALAPNHTHTHTHYTAWFYFIFMTVTKSAPSLVDWLIACLWCGDKSVAKSAADQIQFSCNSHTSRHSIEEDEDEKTSRNHINCIISSILVQTILPAQDHFDCNLENCVYVHFSPSFFSLFGRRCCA